MSSRFSEIYQRDFDILAEAHGRVNLIGEHTDYNGGYVLPTTIPQKTRAFFGKRNDEIVRIYSANTEAQGVGDELRPSEYFLGDEKAQRYWTDYCKGVTWLLRKEGHHITGFDCFIKSDVPIGSGLSSSAALEISLLKGLNELFNLNIDSITMARLGQRVENEFVGARVGIMDQMVCSIGQMNEALFIDTRELSFKRIPIDPEDIELLVISSGVSHNNASGFYNKRRSECEKACELLQVKELRDVTVEDLPKIMSLPDPLHKRVRHVVTENDRVLQAVEALEHRDYQELGRLFKASQTSMREDYEISVPEINVLASLAEQKKGVYGARLTGAGFGGSIVALVKAGHAYDIARFVVTEFNKIFNNYPTVLVPDFSINEVTPLEESPFQK